MNITTKPETVAAIGAVGVVIYLLYKAAQTMEAAPEVVGKAVDKIVNEINPYSTENFIYDNVIGGLGLSVTGEKEWNLGGWIYDITHNYESTITQKSTGASGQW